MLKRATAIAGVLALSGCASQPNPISDDVASELRNSDVAVAFAYPEETIKYTELVYKVLWNEYQTTTSKFSGIWDIESDLAEVYSEELREDGYPAEPFGEVIPDSVYEGFSSNVSAYNPYSENEAVNTFTPTPKTRDALIEKGYEYFVVVRGINLNVYDQVMTNPRIGMANYMTVHNLRSGEIDYEMPLSLQAKAMLDGSARQLEENGLAAYREHLSRAIRELFASEDIQELLSGTGGSG